MAIRPKHVYLIAAARRISRWSLEHRAAIKDAEVGKEFVQCASCKKRIPKNLKIKKRRQFAVDHIEPVVPVDMLAPVLEPTPNSSDFLGWDEWLRRLMYGKRQVLCLPCHKSKTNAENKERKAHARKRQR